MFKRHDMVYISKEGRRKAAEFSAKEYSLMNRSYLLELILNEDIPAIISRQSDAAEGFVQLGFAHYRSENNFRFRVSSMVKINDIIKIINPFEVFSKGVQSDFIRSEILREIDQGASLCGIEVGLYGSAALDLITGYPYMTGKSDIDIFVKKRDNTSDTLGFYNFLKELEKKRSIKIDCEIEAFNDFGMKLQEIFSDQNTVLGKGFHEVCLFNKEELEELI